jgi:hypothetical protein
VDEIEMEWDRTLGKYPKIGDVIEITSEGSYAVIRINGQKVVLKKLDI